MKSDLLFILKKTDKTSEFFILNGYMFPQKKVRQLIKTFKKDYEWIVSINKDMELNFQYSNGKNTGFMCFDQYK